MRAAGYEVRDEKRMWRMTIAASDFRPVANTAAARLSLAAADALEELHADGAVSGEGPRFYSRP